MTSDHRPISRLGAPLSGTPLEGAILRAGGHAPDLSRWRAAIARAARGEHITIAALVN